MNYATVSDIQVLKRPLTADEQSRAEALIPLVCSLIRFEAAKTGRDFDQMIYQSELIPIIDTYTGNGEETSFELSYSTTTPVKATVNGVLVEVAMVDDKTVKFDEAPTGEVMIEYAYRALLEVAEAVVCDVVMRELNTPGAQLPTTSYSESAGGISQSYSLPNASGAIRLWPSDLKTLGLKRQKIGTLNLGPYRG